VQKQKGPEDHLHPEDLQRLQVRLYHVSLDHVLQVAAEAVARQDKLERERLHQMRRDTVQH
jgi:hypothetical protein